MELAVEVDDGMWRCATQRIVGALCDVTGIFREGQGFRYPRGVAGRGTDR